MFGHQMWLKVHLSIPGLARLTDFIYPWSIVRGNWHVSVSSTSFAWVNVVVQLSLWIVVTYFVIIQDADATFCDDPIPGQVFTTVTSKRHLNPYLRKLEHFQYCGEFWTENREAALSTSNTHQVYSGIK